MHNKESHLRELLACYGSDVTKWPEEDKPLGFYAQQHPQLSGLMAAERRFERVLEKRSMAFPSSDLAARIIAASLARPVTATLSRWQFVLPEMRPAALAAMLALGFALGFGMLAPIYAAKQPHMQLYVEDEGTIL